MFLYTVTKFQRTSSQKSKNTEYRKADLDKMISFVESVV